MVSWKNKIPQNNSIRITELQFTTIMFHFLILSGNFLLSWNRYPKKPTPKPPNKQQQQTKQNKTHKNKPVTIYDTWKISPLSYKFKSSAAMKSIYLLILLLFWTASTTTDCPRQSDQTQVSAWCSQCCCINKTPIFGVIFNHFLFFIGFVLLYAPLMPPAPSAQQSTDISAFLFSKSSWALPDVHWAKSDCHLFHQSQRCQTIPWFL